MEQTIQLNISSTSGNNKIIFNSVKVDSANNLLIFDVTVSKNAEFVYTSKDKNGNQLETAYNANTIWVSKGSLENYSTVYITYTVNSTSITSAESTSPVTVTINIPGIQS